MSQFFMPRWRREEASDALSLVFGEGVREFDGVGYIKISFVCLRSAIVTHEVSGRTQQ